MFRISRSILGVFKMMLCLFKPLVQSSRSSLMCTNPSALYWNSLLLHFKLDRALNGTGRIFGIWTLLSFNVSLDRPIPWLSWWYWLIRFDPDCAARHWGSTLTSGGPLPLETLQHSKTHEGNSRRSDGCRVDEMVVRWWWSDGLLP